MRKGIENQLNSLFEEHTEGISKGKAGVPQALGLKACILEDPYGFILHHHVMEHQTAARITVFMVLSDMWHWPCWPEISRYWGHLLGKKPSNLWRAKDKVQEKN